MDAFLISTGIVALAEMGDKTQLLSLVLAARFRKPWPIVLGILVATLFNHALAGAAGGPVVEGQVGAGVGSGAQYDDRAAAADVFTGVLDDADDAAGRVAVHGV